MSEWKKEFDQWLYGKRTGFEPIPESRYVTDTHNDHDINESGKWKRARFFIDTHGGSEHVEGLVNGVLGIRKFARCHTVTLLTNGLGMGSVGGPQWWVKAYAEALLEYAISPCGMSVDVPLARAMLMWFERRWEASPKPKRGG